MCRLVLVVLLSFCSSFCFAGGPKDQAPEAAISALVMKAGVAPPKEQCFLYAELVHDMTELAGRQVTAGEDASATLRLVHEYTEKIHLGVARDTKRLKNAQILMERTAFRLNEILHSSPSDTRPALEATLKQLNDVQSELMMQVFRK
jgi:hypothetical protein